MQGKAYRYRGMGERIMNKKILMDYQMQRIKEIQTKLENSIGYNRDKQLEICMKKKSKKDDDIGEDALVLAVKKG